ncbi:MAG TPA: thioredoxin family protein [Phycisphaerales bacterium]|nr:thioredoxin family protein [Phycisphaerales bacterium]
MMLCADEKPLKAPDFVLKNHDGKEVKLADYKGKIVVLEWMNQECPFVKYHYEKKSTMKELAARYKDKKVVWLAIDSTSHQKTEKNRKYARKNKILHPILDDRPGTVGKAYRATNTPHMFIIDKNGNIAYNGAIDNAPLGRLPKDKELINYVDEALNELVSGNTVSIAKTKPYGCSVKYKKK